MGKKKIVVKTEWTEDNIMYYRAYNDDEPEISGVGETKKKALEDYEETLRNYERMNGRKGQDL